MKKKVSFETAKLGWLSEELVNHGFLADFPDIFRCSKPQNGEDLNSTLHVNHQSSIGQGLLSYNLYSLSLLAFFWPTEKAGVCSC